MNRLLQCLLVIFIALPGTVGAMEITERPDLAARLLQLNSIYSDNWRPSPGSEGLGNTTIFHLSGEIKKGDTERIGAVLENSWGKYIVLESHGGSFLEGIELGRYFQYNRSSSDPDIFGIFVLKDGPCKSACALALAMAASTRDIAFDDDIRFVEQGAELGFHMGLLPEAKASQLVEAKEILNLSYDIVQAYTGLIMGGIAPEILLSEALAHRTRKSFFTLGGGLRTHAMRLTPVGDPKFSRPVNLTALSVQNVAGLCRTAFVADPDLPKSFVDYDHGTLRISEFDPVATSLTELADRLGSRRLAASLNGTATCLIELRDDGTLAIGLDNGPPGCPAESSICADVSDRNGRPLLPTPVALLADTYGCHSGTLTTRTQPWVRDIEGATDETQEAPMTRRVSRDVNVRAAPSLNSARVDQLSAGEEVGVTDCAIVDDTQGVWMAIEAGGRSGWVSARFLYTYAFGWDRPALDGPAQR